MNVLRKFSASGFAALHSKRNQFSTILYYNAARFGRRVKKLNDGKGQGEVGKAKPFEVEDVSPEEGKRILKESKLEEEEAKLEFQAMKEKLFSNQYEKELDKKIMKLIEEGKNNNEIVDEILREKPKVVKEKNNLFEGKKKEDVTIFDLFQTHLFKENPEILGETKEYQRKIDRESEHRKTVTGILKKSPNSNPISELPIHEKLNKRRKMTQKEREEIELNVGLMQQYVMTQERNKIPKDIHKKKFYVDEAEDKDENNEGNEEASKDLKKAEEQLPEKLKEGKIKDLKVQFINSQTQDDKEFKSLAQKDSDNSAKDLGIYEPPPKMGDKYETRKKSTLPDSSWTQSEKRLAKMEEKYGDIDTILSGEFALMEKDFTLAKKKLEEENAEYKKFLEKKRKIKKIKEITREIEEEPYKDNINYRDHKLNQPKKNEKKDPYLFAMPDIDRIDAMNEEEAKLLMKDSEFEIHRTRSLKNIEDYIGDHFTKNKRSVEGVLRGKNIVITEVSANFALTVIYVFWDLLDESLNPTAKGKNEQKIKETEMITSQIDKNLEKYAKYFGGVICKELGFKFAPEVRFIKGNYSENYEEITQELRQTIPEVTKQELKEKMEKEGKIPIIKKQQLEDATELNINVLLEEALKQQTYAEIKKKEKMKKLYDEKGERVRKNRDEEGKKKKYMKKDKASNFWSNLRS